MLKSDVSRQQSLPGSICGFSDNASVADNDTDVVNENSGEGGLTQEQIDELFNGISSAEEEEEKSNTSKPKTDDTSPEIKTYLEDTSVNNKSDYSSANETALQEDKNSQGDNQKRNLKDDSERIDGNITVNATEQVINYSKLKFLDVLFGSIMYFLYCSRRWKRVMRTLRKTNCLLSLLRMIKLRVKPRITAARQLK